MANVRQSRPDSGLAFEDKEHRPDSGLGRDPPEEAVEEVC